MPCEPRLMRDDDDDSELDDLKLGDSELVLPADLELLAEQLTLDAQYLAAQYPYPSTQYSDAAQHDAPSSAPPVTSARHRVLWFRVAAMVIAAVGIGSATRYAPRWWQSDVPAAPVAVRVDAGTTRAASDQNGSSEVLPAVLFGDLSGPEREAWLDLLEDEAFSPSSLSI
jgi:hypothetical protein